MAKKLSLIDIGELGWSIELSAHARWLTEHDHQVEVLTYVDRRALYPFISKLKLVPHVIGVEDGLGLHGLEGKLDHFKRHLDYPLHPEFKFGCHNFWGNNMTFKPYNSQSIYKPRVLIFPRYRTGEHAKRNLTKEFWDKLASQHKVTSVGRIPGSYHIKNVQEDRVSPSTSVQDVIDLCNTAVCAIGSQSSLPVLSLLQGVPTFVIGHDQERMKKFGSPEFYHTNYKDLDIDECLEKITSWINVQNLRKST